MNSSWMRPGHGELPDGFEGFSSPVFGEVNWSKHSDWRFDSLKFHCYFRRFWHSLWKPKSFPSRNSGSMLKASCFLRLVLFSFVHMFDFFSSPDHWMSYTPSTGPGSSATSLEWFGVLASQCSWLKLFRRAATRLCEGDACEGRCWEIVRSVLKRGCCTGFEREIRTESFRR